MAWRPQEQRDRSRTHIDLKDIEFAGFGPAIYLDVSPANFAAENVLKVGAGDFLQWRDPGQTDWKCQLRQVTLRQSGSLLSCWPRAADSRLSHLSLELEGCVFDLATDRLSPNSGPSRTKSRMPLVCWMTKKLPSNWASAIDWQSTGVLVAPNTSIVAWFDHSNRKRTEVDETSLDIDGIERCKLAMVASPIGDPSWVNGVLIDGAVDLAAVIFHVQRNVNRLGLIRPQRHLLYQALCQSSLGRGLIGHSRQRT